MGLHEAAKDAFKIAKSLDNIELQTQLLDLQEQALELVAENQSLREELALSKMEFRDDGMYWDGDDSPYCPKCIPTGVRARVSPNKANGFWVCNVCRPSPVGAPLPPDW